MLKIIQLQFVKHFKLFVLFPALFLIGIFSATRSFGQKLLKSEPTPLAKSKLPGQFDWFNPGLWYNPLEDSLRQSRELLEMESLRQQIKEYSMNFIGRPYRSSGKNPASGFDCSGFTGFVFRNFGLKLKASSTEQAKDGQKVKKCEAKTGDLAFFGRKDSKGRFFVNHAAIVISKPGEPLAIIHSASNKGIVITKVEESRYWRNALLFVKTVL